MPTYGELMLLILPVFGVMGVGVALRRARWLNAEADDVAAQGEAIVAGGARLEVGVDVVGGEALGELGDGPHGRQRGLGCRRNCRQHAASGTRAAGPRRARRLVPLSRAAGS